MQVSNEDGQRNLTMKIWSLGEKVLVRIDGPQDQAGTAILKVGRDIWYYLPKTRRTVKLPTSMTMTPWMGSAFTIDDLVNTTVGRVLDLFGIDAGLVKRWTGVDGKLKK